MICPACGYGLSGDDAICRHHGAAFAEGWASINRTACDFFHRRVVPAAVALDEPIPTDYADVA